MIKSICLFNSKVRLEFHNLKKHLGKIIIDIIPNF